MDHSDDSKKNWRFFSHTACEYFPCHPTEHPEDFNCLFCYCPLYALGARCGGDFVYTKEGVKDCSRCLLPHGRDACRLVALRFPDLARLAARDGGELPEGKRPEDAR